MPVQRIPRYVMLLKELLKYTPPDHPDFSDLQSARFKIEQVTQALDAKKQQAENLAKLMSIADMITKKGTQVTCRLFSSSFFYLQLTHHTTESGRSAQEIHKRRKVDG